MDSGDTKVPPMRRKRSRESEGEGSMSAGQVDEEWQTLSESKRAEMQDKLMASNAAIGERLVRQGLLDHIRVRVPNGGLQLGCRFQLAQLPGVVFRNVPPLVKYLVEAFAQRDFDARGPVPDVPASASSSQMLQPPDCPICFEPMRGARRPVSCDACGEACCLACLQQNAEVLGTKPRCVFERCRREFSDEFVHCNFPSSWRDKKLRYEIEEKNCIAQMRAMLPGRQLLAAAVREVRQVAQEATNDTQYLTRLHDEELQARQQLAVAQRHLTDIKQRRKWAVLDHGNFAVLMRHGRALQHARQQQEDAERPDARPAERGAAGSRLLIRCVVPDCRGFVNGTTSGRRYVPCGLCGTIVCMLCERPVAAEDAVAAPEDGNAAAKAAAAAEEGAEAGGSGGHGHVCDSADRENVAAVRRLTKPCPWPGCGVRIMRSMGCAQMWCTACNKPFDWTSGRCITDTRQLHNPHYFEYINSQAQQQQQQQQQGCCEQRVVNAFRLPSHVSQTDSRLLTGVMRSAQHFFQVELQQRRARTDTTYQETIDSIAVPVLIGDATEQQMTGKWYLMKRSQTYSEEELQLLDAAYMVAAEQLNSLVPTSTADEVRQVLEQLESVRKYWNAQLSRLALRYKRLGVMLCNQYSGERVTWWELTKGTGSSTSTA